MPKLITEKETNNYFIGFNLKELTELLFDVGNSDLEFRKCDTLVLRDLFDLLAKTDSVFNNQLQVVLDETNRQQIWRMPCYLKSAERLNKQRAYSERRRLWYNLRDEATKIISTSVQTLTESTQEVADTIARTLINKKAISKCKQFGVDLESDEWKILLENIE